MANTGRSHPLVRVVAEDSVFSADCDGCSVCVSASTVPDSLVFNGRRMNIADIENIIDRCRFKTKTIQRCSWALNSDSELSLTITIVSDDPRAGAFFERALANEFGLYGMAPWFDNGGCEVKHCYTVGYAKYRLCELNRKTVKEININEGGVIEVDGDGGAGLATQVLPLIERPLKAFDELPSHDEVVNALTKQCFFHQKGTCVP